MRLVATSCVAYLGHVCNVSAKAFSIDSFLIVHDFPEVFLADLPGLPRKRDFDFALDFEPDTMPIFILPYPMALAELKKIHV